MTKGKGIFVDMLTNRTKGKRGNLYSIQCKLDTTHLFKYLFKPVDYGEP
jgi:hypothetical protein